ncbi:MAG: M48 family metalloprotease [bacterium]
MEVVIGKRVLLCVLVVSVLSGLVGCAGSDQNPHDSWVLVSESAEKDMGKTEAKRLEKEVGLYESDTYVRYLNNVGNRVAVYSQRPDLDYKFRILDIFWINALALPGGYVYVTRGLLDNLESEAELAGVLAHETAHIAAYHAIKRQQWSVISMLSAAAVATQTGGRGLGESLMAQQMVIQGYTRSSEDQADQLGMEYMARSGYDPEGLINFLRTLQEIHGEIPDRRVIMLRTHPFLVDRIDKASGDLSYYRSLLSDTPMVKRHRYNRYKRRYLYRHDEEAFLSRFNGFVEAYEEQNLTRLETMLAEDFRVGDEDSGDTSAQFLAELKDRFRDSVEINYDYRLLNLDVGDTQATIQYEFNSERKRPGTSVPKINNGVQLLKWRKKDASWYLKTLM